MSRFLALSFAVSAFALSSAAAWAGNSVVVRTPEPASLLLLASGVAGVAVFKRFRRNK